MTWDVIHGDCLDVLRTMDAASVDAIVTDPPYGIGRDGQTRTTGGHGGRKYYEHKGWDAARPDRSAFAQILSFSVPTVIWGGNYFAEALPTSGGWLVWDKGQRIQQSDGELAWTNVSASLRIVTMNRVEIMLDGAVHPTQKPVALMRWCIEKLKLEPGATVLDPFCGSGSTGVAAVQMGFSFIGIEREADYCEIARKRIAAAAAQGNLFHEVVR